MSHRAAAANFAGLDLDQVSLIKEEVSSRDEIGQSSDNSGAELLTDAATRLGVKQPIVAALLTAMEVEPDETDSVDVLMVGLMADLELEEFVENMEIQGKKANPWHKAAARKLFWAAKQAAGAFKAKALTALDDAKPSLSVRDPYMEPVEQVRAQIRRYL